MNVPFVDLKSQYQSLKSEVDAAMLEVCTQGSFILGPQVSAFEESFARFVGAKYCVGLANGTESLTLAYQALGLGAGDEVLMPANTFVATAIGAMQAGLRPILVDIGSNYLMDLNLAEKALTPQTKAICPVHLYGRACNMDEILSFAKHHNLKVIEDAAQSHGAAWGGKTTGTFGDIGSFSFYPGKNLGAYGDGGAIVTSSEATYKKVRKLRNYGSEIKYEHPEIGTNCRLDSVQAAVLNVKLKHLARWNRQRWEAAKAYNELMGDLTSRGVVLPDLASPEGHVFHLYVIQLEERDRVLQHLNKNGVQAGIHYPNPFHLQGGYTALGYRAGDFPETERIARRILSLPMFPEITLEQVEFAVQRLREALM